MINKSHVKKEKNSNIINGVKKNKVFNSSKKMIQIAKVLEMENIN